MNVAGQLYAICRQAHAFQLMFSPIDTASRVLSVVCTTDKNGENSKFPRIQ